MPRGGLSPRRSGGRGSERHEAAALAPTVAPVYVSLARARASQGKEDAARQALERALALAPADAKLLCEAGKQFQDLD